MYRPYQQVSDMQLRALLWHSEAELQQVEAELQELDELLRELDELQDPATAARLLMSFESQKVTHRQRKVHWNDIEEHCKSEFALREGLSTIEH